MALSLKYTTASTNTELEQILLLQQNNLSTSISEEEKKKEGFVTVQHNFEVLKKMNDNQPHIIAKDGIAVVGYTLCMTPDFSNYIPILKPMFEEIKKSPYHSIKFIVMGQVCIDKKYRGLGIFRGLYQKMKTELHEKYELLITEIATSNFRSLHAHIAIGFKVLKTYNSNGIDWHIVFWDWD